MVKSILYPKEIKGMCIIKREEVPFFLHLFIFYYSYYSYYSYFVGIGWFYDNHIRLSNPVARLLAFAT